MTSDKNRKLPDENCAHENSLDEKSGLITDLTSTQSAESKRLSSKNFAAILRK